MVKPGVTGRWTEEERRRFASPFLFTDLHHSGPIRVTALAGSDSQCIRTAELANTLASRRSAAPGPGCSRLHSARGPRYRASGTGADRPFDTRQGRDPLLADRTA